MDFSINAEQQAAVDRIAGLFAERIAPRAQAADRAGALPPETFVSAAAAGFFRLYVPDGASEPDFLVRASAEEALAKACASTFRAVWSSALCAGTIARFGSDDVKGRWLPLLLDGKASGSVALAEADGAPDRAALSARAERAGDGFRLSGEKVSVVNGPDAAIAVVVAVTGEGGALTAFAVDLSLSGVTRREVPRGMGLRACPMAALSFDGVALGAGDVLGEVGGGATILAGLREQAALGMAHFGIAVGEAAMEAAMRHATETQAFGRPLARQQAIHFRIADMKVEIDAARLMARRVAWLRSEGRAPGPLASLGKLFATEMAVRVTDWAMQIFGPEGYAEGSTIERLYRDARVGPLVEGASEVQRDAIAAALLDD